MAIVTYSNASLGFGVTYDDADLARADSFADPRLAAAWIDRLSTRVAGGVIFCPSGATPERIAGGRAPSLLIATDTSRLAPGVLSRWDWDEAISREAQRFMTLTGAGEIETTAVYWRGFPVLQLATGDPSADDAAAGDPAAGGPAAPVELLGMLYTPAQTFASLFVVPRGLEDPWLARFQEVMDGFFLLPIEREGRVRTGHQHVRSLHLSRADLEDLAAR